MYLLLYFFVQRAPNMLPAYEGLLLIKERASATPRHHHRAEVLRRPFDTYSSPLKRRV
jgi:hypothetical protein